MRVLEFLLGRDVEDAKKLFDEAHADLIDTINSIATKRKMNGHSTMAHRPSDDDVAVAGSDMRPDSRRVLGNKHNN